MSPGVKPIGCKWIFKKKLKSGPLIKPLARTLASETSNESNAYFLRMHGGLPIIVIGDPMKVIQCGQTKSYISLERVLSPFVFCQHMRCLVKNPSLGRMVVTM